MVEHYIGVDLHKAFFQACAVDPFGQRCWEDRFPTTAAGVGAFLSRTARNVAVAVEASGPTWTFVDQLHGRLARVVVVDAAKTRWKAGYAAKTDRLDARRLADALRRDSVATIYYPPPPIRELRELCRLRRSLVRTATGLKHRLHALLLRQGVVAPMTSSLWHGRGARWLATLTLPGRAGESLVSLRQVLADVTDQVDGVEAEVVREASHDPIVLALQQLPGIGPVLGLTIRAEIGEITRFPDPPHLASYAGVVPRVSQSGLRRAWTGPITKQGSPWLRWALIEAAIHGVNRPDAIGRWARRLAVHKGGLKTRVAIARTLCAEIFATWPRT
ncbi:MAG TPA: IS110 family transposase [Vicinamibacterales bacterium]|jgi:transposase|nr:IS110 family transposase [Vicinamibacterales bacterium]